MGGRYGRCHTMHNAHHPGDVVSDAAPPTSKLTSRQDETTLQRLRSDFLRFACLLSSLSSSHTFNSSEACCRAVTRWAELSGTGSSLVQLWTICLRFFRLEGGERGGREEEIEGGRGREEGREEEKEGGREEEKR